MPSFGDYKEGKSLLPKQGDLVIDAAKAELYMVEKGKKVQLGNSFIYVVD